MGTGETLDGALIALPDPGVPFFGAANRL